MNESASILLLLIVGVWFATSSRFQAFAQVMREPAQPFSWNTTNSTTIPGIPKGSGLYPQENSTNPTYQDGLNGVQEPTGGKMA